VGGDGLLSGRNSGITFITAERRINFGIDRGCRGTISAGACALARCLPADTARRIVAGPHFLAWNMLAYGVGIALAVWLDRFAVSIFDPRLRRHAGAR
jgi:hypothetical protein